MALYLTGRYVIHFKWTGTIGPLYTPPGFFVGANMTTIDSLTMVDSPAQIASLYIVVDVNAVTVTNSDNIMNIVNLASFSAGTLSLEVFLLPVLQQ